MTITVSVDGDEEVKTLLSKMNEEMTINARKAIQKSAFKIKKTVTNRLKDGPMYSRTGLLAKSFHYQTKLKNELKDLYTTLYTDSTYAPIHETGGTINAKNAYTGLSGGPYLNIPSSFNKTAAGVMRENARSVFQNGGYIRRKRSGKAPFMVMSKDGTPMFWLVKSVDIPARLEFVKTATDEVPTLLSNLNKVLLDGLE